MKYIIVIFENGDKLGYVANNSTVKTCKERFLAREFKTIDSANNYAIIRIKELKRNPIFENSIFDYMVVNTL